MRYYFCSTGTETSIAASPEFWEGPYIFDYQRATVFGMGHSLLKHKRTRYAKNLAVGMTPLVPLGYTYDGNDINC